MTDKQHLQRMAAAHAACFVKLHRQAASTRPLMVDMAEEDACAEPLDRARWIMTVGGRQAWEFVLATIACLPDDKDLLRQFGAGDFEYCWSVEENADPFLMEIEAELASNAKLCRVLEGCWPRSTALAELRERLISSGLLQE